MIECQGRRNGRNGKARRNDEANRDAEARHDCAAGNAEVDIHARPGSDRRADGRLSGIQGDDGQL